MERNERNLSCFYAHMRGAIFLSFSVHCVLFFLLMIACLYQQSTSGSKESYPLIIKAYLKRNNEIDVHHNARPHTELVKTTPSFAKRVYRGKLKSSLAQQDPKKDFLSVDNIRFTSDQDVRGEGQDNASKYDRITNEPIVRVKPVLLNGDQVKVPYPDRARRLMIEGIVHMRLTVSATGKVIDAEILSSSPFDLGKAALMVAKNLYFLPATNEYGQAKTAQIDHEVVFKLTKS
jgi:TonB family protein